MDGQREHKTQLQDRKIEWKATTSKMKNNGYENILERELRSTHIGGTISESATEQSNKSF